MTQILTSWDRLQRLLRDTIEPAHYHLGCNFERVEQSDGGVRVHFSGGRVEDADIVVGGDGVRSSVRAQIMPDVQPIYAGYYIWRGTANEADLSPRALREVFPYFSFFLPPQQEVICYPISGFNNDIRPGHRRFNFIWYRVADAKLLNEMCVDEKGHQHEYSVPPPLIRKDLIAALRAEADVGLPPALNDCLRAIDQPFFTPIYDFIAPQHRVRPRRAGRRCRIKSAPAHGFWRVEGRLRRPGAGQRLARSSTISTAGSPNTIASASRSARSS